MKTHTLLQEFIDDAVALNYDESVQYKTDVGDGSITITASRFLDNLNITVSDGENTSQPIEAERNDDSIVVAMRHAMMHLLINATKNTLGVYTIRSGSTIVARCGIYSSNRMRAEDGEEAALRLLAVDIIEYIQ